MDKLIVYNYINLDIESEIRIKCVKHNLYIYRQAIFKTHKYGNIIGYRYLLLNVYRQKIQGLSHCTPECIFYSEISTSMKWKPSGKRERIGLQEILDYLNSTYNEESLCSG